MAKALTDEIEVGRIYEGPIKRITNFGAFVEVAPKTDGLVHISQIADKHIKEVTDVLQEGETVRVKVLNVDNFGKIKLTMKEVEQAEEIAARIAS